MQACTRPRLPCLVDGNREKSPSRPRPTIPREAIHRAACRWSAAVPILYRSDGIRPPAVVTRQLLVSIGTIMATISRRKEKWTQLPTSQGEGAKDQKPITTPDPTRFSQLPRRGAVTLSFLCSSFTVDAVVRFLCLDHRKPLWILQSFYPSNQKGPGIIIS